LSGLDYSAGPVIFSPTIATQHYFAKPNVAQNEHTEGIRKPVNAEV
jgi:hypothetical protein